MYEIPAHHLAAPRPAPIAFPEVAGVHAPDCAESEQQPVSQGLQSAETSSTQKSEAREQQQLRAGLCHHEERAS